MRPFILLFFFKIVFTIWGSLEIPYKYLDRLFYSERNTAGILRGIALNLKITSGNSSIFSSVQFSSVAQLCPTLCDPMNRSTPGLPVHHQLPEFTQTHVHPVGDAIQPSHPLSSPSPPAPNPSQHQSLFQ